MAYKRITETHVKTIDYLTRMPSSRFGNPRYSVHFTDGTNYATEVDGSVAYGIENKEYQDAPLKVTLEIGRRYAYVTNLERI